MRRTTIAIIILGLAVAVGCVASLGRSADAPAPAPAATPVPPATAPAVPATPPAPPPADATIGNAPSLAGSIVIDLPTPPAGEVRSLVAGDGCFAITAEGDLARGFAAIPAATTKRVTVRQTKQADGSFRDTTYAIAVAAAPWTLDAFPEMIVQSLTQEGVARSGPVAEVAFGGLAALTRRNHLATAPAGAEPLRLADGKGIEFAAGSGRHLLFKPESEALLLNRWALVIFRAEPGRTAMLLCVNDGPQGNGRSGNWMPRLECDASDGSVMATWRGTKRHQLKSPAGSVALDGRWNVALTLRRHGRLFLRVNGRDCDQASPTESFSTERPDDMTESRIGDKSKQAPAWALDGLWIGQSELSEAVVGKMEAWALARAGGLPGGAAATPTGKPVIDAEDFPRRYTFDAERWAAWKKANPKEKRLAFQGQPVAKVQPDRSGWVRVFHDDFRKPAQVSPRAINGSSVGDSTFDLEGGRQIWYAPGTNSAVGGFAICKDGNDLPWKDVYVPDPAAGTLTMRLYCSTPAKDGKPGQWRSSQFSSVNEAGLGHSWAGAKGFRVRAKFSNAGPELFPAPLWFYSLEHLFWRTGERIEFDIVELDAAWDNYGASHVHPGAFKGLFGHSPHDTMKKSAPEEIRSPKLAAGKQVCGIDAWDGEFHTWEVWIEDDLTYINVDGLEVARVATTPEYLERFYMYVDTCLKSEKGMDPTRSYDMVLDSIEGFQPAAVVDAVPGAPFTGRPTLAGSDGVITCTANIVGCDDVWYFWYADGYPRGFGTARTHTVLAEDAGAQIRCLVRAVGAKDQPEAWTAPLPIR